MSVPIKAFAEFLKLNLKELTEEDVEVVFKGYEKFEGLLSLCGTKNKFSESLKKSASTSLKIILELVHIELPNLFATIFLTLDADDY